ncbi:ATP-binding cassette domain-containing protein [Streptococcus merionis]|uniref:ATP-binding cassette domain-containing protein n=1 Tax=Streptococcus merionis TaxID=400065 RepID=UPI003515D1D0
MKLYRYKHIPMAIFSTITFSLLSVLLSYSMSLLIAQNQNELLKRFFSVFVIYLLHSIALFWNLRSIAKAETSLQSILAQQTDIHFAKMNFEQYHQKDHGEHLSMYINDIPKVIELTLDKYLSRIKMATTAIGSFVALIKIHYSLGLVAIVAFTFMTFVPKFFQQKLRHYISGLQTEKASYTSKTRELLQGYTTFFENMAFSVFFHKSSAATKKYTDYQLKTQTFTATMSACLTFVNGFVSVVAVAYVSYLVIRNQVEAGALLAVLSLIPSFGSSVIQFLSEGEFYKSGLALFDEKLAFAKDSVTLQEPSTIQIDESNQSEYTHPYSLSLKNIKIPFKNQLSFPDMTFLPHQKYAIMGESGLGKSSLVKVLIGEIEKYSGEVFVNNKEKKSSQHLFNIISYMNQETFLFNDSIKNNIDLLGQMSDDDVQQLLNAVGLESFSPELVIHDNGKNLSGGQRQRLAFARAIARKKEILILDEATANLDTQSAQILEGLAIQSAKTVIMITHHMSDTLRPHLDDVITIRSLNESRR